MKKASVNKGTGKSISSNQLNMKLSQEDEKNKSHYMSESDCMVESQADYIENLQQQIFVLENEIGYLRKYLQDSNKQHPSMIVEGERMVKKLSDYQGEIKSMKVELKRKQTTVDLLRSEKDRTHRNLEESEERFRKEKCRVLEELLTSQKERDALQESNSKIEASFRDLKQEHKTLQEDFDNLEVDLQQIERERHQDKEIIEGLMESKGKLQKDLIETKMAVDAKASLENDEAVKELKGRVEQLSEEVETLKRSRDHEHLLRERLSADNADLIKRHAQTEADAAESRARLREEQSKLSSLEQVHLGTILDASEAKSKHQSLKDEIQQLNVLLKEENERSYNLSHQLSDERRFKAREEEKLRHLQQRFEQLQEATKAARAENVAVARDNAFLKDEGLNLKQQLHHRDEEVLHLKHKVQEMQVSVEEFIQNSQAANRLAGEKWKQLGKLAQSIQALTRVEENNC